MAVFTSACVGVVYCCKFLFSSQELLQALWALAPLGLCCVPGGPSRTILNTSVCCVLHIGWMYMDCHMLWPCPFPV